MVESRFLFSELIANLGMSVSAYFMDKYCMRLKYPDLPLVCEKKGKMFTYYPMEILKISPLQTVKVQKLGKQVRVSSLEV